MCPHIVCPAKDWLASKDPKDWTAVCETCPLASTIKLIQCRVLLRGDF